MIGCWWKRESESFLAVICEFFRDVDYEDFSAFAYLFAEGGGGGVGGSQFRTLGGHISHM